MDGIFVAFVAVLAVGLAVAIGFALERDRALDAARSAVLRARVAEPGNERARDDRSEDLPTLVRRLRDRLDASELELDQQVRNASYLADLMGVGILRLGEGGTVELANAAAHILLRRPPGSLRGRSALETFVDARVEDLIGAARATGASSGEFRLSGPDGPILIVRARRSPVRGVWVVLEDVSELRRLQQIRTEFVDNLSHELRTPLSTVSLLAETLAREAIAAGEGVPPKMRERIAKIEVETGHLVQMVNELLDLARIEGGGPLVLLDDVDLGRVATEAADRLRLFAERQGIDLVVDLSGPIPAVRGDEARLGQVVVNLIHNALKFGSPGDDGARDAAEHADAGSSTAPRPSEVRVAVHRIGDDVALSVEDHGVGIPKADQARIFERFYKVDRVRVRGGGTGLGLAIARHVVEQHGGRIEVESEEGEGSTFTVTLPVAPPVGATLLPVESAP
ncbi:MAG TPA: ATP-binding protein [Candidatus Limnocylindrales bacterium]|nr:ATP-binding protein [Candidatus Limnocylindrales bacterium]